MRSNFQNRLARPKKQKTLPLTNVLPRVGKTRGDRSIIKGWNEDRRGDARREHDRGFLGKSAAKSGCVQFQQLLLYLYSYHIIYAVARTRVPRASLIIIDVDA